MKRNIEKLEREVQRLDRTELSTFREWFYEYDSEAWDRQLEDDVKSGKLDALGDAALAAHKSGKTKEL